jgi:hypothetical protein
MAQKALVGLLVLTVVGALGIGIYDASQSDAPANTDALADDAASAANAGEATNAANTIDQPAAQATLPIATPTQDAAGAATAGTPVAAEPQQVQQAQAMVGDPWTASGTITALDTAGVMLALDDGREVFVELGPPSYWQAQPITLDVGTAITVDGFNNGDQVHAATVRTTTGAELALRTADGQPLWAGSTGSGGNGAAGSGAMSGQPVEEVTIAGTVSAVDSMSLTMQTAAGETLTLQLGAPSFWQAQGVSFSPGDPIEVIGFWQGAQFQAAQITKTATSERLMLRDTNGRPLSSGPGRAGSQSQGGQGQAQGGQGQGSQGAQGQGGQGGQGQAMQVPADQWETITGTVSQTEARAVTLQLASGSTARVVLGEMDFWSADGFYFSIGDQLRVAGYWLNGNFEAGEVTFTATGDTLTIRDEFGRLLWVDPTGSQGSQGGQGQGQSNGNGYRGGRN